MSSIWSNAAVQAGSFPFASSGSSGSAGGGPLTQFQSILQPSGKHANAADSTTGTNSTSGDSSSSGTDTTISANDFLTLLVTEMQNQDPTADTDPNEYINQLVQINSLEQLISINQNLSTVLGASSSSAAADGANGAGTNASAIPPAAKPSATQAVAGKAGAIAAGNLSTPKDKHAAQTVGRALDGHLGTAGRGHAIRDIPTRPLP